MGVRAAAVLATGLEVRIRVRVTVTVRVRVRSPNPKPNPNQANTALYTLDLSYNRVLGLDGMGLGEYCPDGALALCRALEANTSLQHLLLEVSQPEPCSPG